MPTTVQVRHVTQRTLMQPDDSGVSSSSTIHMESADASVHVRLIGADPEDYPAGSAFEINITPAA